MRSGVEKCRCDIRHITFKPGKSPYCYKIDTYFGWYEVFEAVAAIQFNENYGVTRETHFIRYRKIKENEE